MRSRWNSVGRISTVLVLSGAIVAGTYAFTAANTVPATKAGDGQGAITGYIVSTVHYDLNAANPANIDQVTFTLDSTPAVGSTMTAQLVAGGTWYPCTNVVADVTCTTAGATVLSAANLRVIVAD
jgi:hypothetical protein